MQAQKEVEQKADPGAAQKRAPAWRRWLSIGLILPLVAFSWLAVFRGPTTKLWLASIFYTEAGHFIAVLLLLGCLLVDRSRLHGQLLSLVGIAGIGLVLSPWARAISTAPLVTQEIQGAFGAQGPLRGKEAPGQSTPLMWQRILGMSHPGVKRTSYHIAAPTGEKLLLDFYQRNTDKKAQPLLVSIHGGAWRSGSPRMLTSINYYLAARGISVAAISYRLAPKYRFPTQLQDVKRSLEWLQSKAKDLHINPQRIALMGRSAGGHLALLAGYRKLVPGIRAVISFYAPTDMHWSWTHPSNPWVIDSPTVLRNFLGGTPSQVKKTYDAASPIQFVTAQSPPTLLIHGTRDEVVSYQHSRRLAQRLKEQGVTHYLLELPWATHGCDAILSGPSGQLSLYAIERFLQDAKVIGSR